MEPGDITVDIKAEVRLSYRNAGAVEVREEWVKRKVTRRLGRASARRQDRAESRLVPAARPRLPPPARRADRGSDRCRCGARESDGLLPCICEYPKPPSRVRPRQQADFRRANPRTPPTRRRPVEPAPRDAPTRARRNQARAARERSGVAQPSSRPRRRVREQPPREGRVGDGDRSGGHGDGRTHQRQGPSAIGRVGGIELPGAQQCVPRPNSPLGFIPESEGLLLCEAMVGLSM
ncbi:hypothetical protein PG985_008135 [Apiospora marii]|uniref:uncharacterized protein n=1 Tax=Apiospora marii TaxID=335849 RepID=UPI00313295FC